MATGETPVPAAKAKEEGRMDYAKIHGFNYQPSYGSSGIELWQQFDAAVIERELRFGKKLFPKMNAIRLWLSWDSFKRDGKRFAAHFEKALDIAGRLGLLVMPVLFNRWHDSVLDYGGIYIDHFWPGAGWVQWDNMFGPFMETIVGGHAADPRILAWDLCNEPFAYNWGLDGNPEVKKAELAWLEGLYKTCKRLNAQAPVTVGTHQSFGMKGVEVTEPISDVISIHSYWTNPPHGKPEFERALDECVALAERVKKPLVASETCWGSLDDKVRVEIIRFTLSNLKKRRIGWLAYLLHHSLIADAHRPEFGPTGGPGNLAFIEADDTLRPGHEIFNEFCEE
jgi:hypothetical protein